MTLPSTGSGVRAPRRRYDSPLRRQRAAETRDRIVAAGSALAHELPSWDWRALTFRAVADRAGISERTVYRYFPSETVLHDAVMRQLEAEAGVSYEGITIDEVSAVARRVFASLSSFAVAPATVDDPTFVAEGRRRHEALLRAVASATPGWREHERRQVAAVLDVLWDVASYQRMVTTWQLDGSDAAGAIDWSISVIVAGMREAPRPASGAPPGASAPRLPVTSR